MTDGAQPEWSIRRCNLVRTRYTTLQNHTSCQIILLVLSLVSVTSSNVRYYPDSGVTSSRILTAYFLQFLFYPRHRPFSLVGLLALAAVRSILL